MVYAQEKDEEKQKKTREKREATRKTPVRKIKEEVSKENTERPHKLREGESHKAQYTKREEEGKVNGRRLCTDKRREDNAKRKRGARERESTNTSMYKFLYSLFRCHEKKNDKGT